MKAGVRNQKYVDELYVKKKEKKKIWKSAEKKSQKLTSREECKEKLNIAIKERGEVWCG